MTEKRIKDINNCHKEREDRINLTVPKGEREMIQNHAAGHNESTNKFSRRAINKTIERDKTFAERKEEVIETAQKYGVAIEDEAELKQLAEAFAVLAPYLPNIRADYFYKRKPPIFVQMQPKGPVRLVDIRQRDA